MTPTAAVAIIEIGEDPPVVLLMRRSQRAGDPWSGQWALPGGRQQPEDGDLFATCVREVAEEVGIILQPRDCRKAVPPVLAGRHVGQGVMVAPFYFILPTRPQIVPQVSEVASTLWLPLAALRDRAQHCLGPVMPHRPDDHFPHVVLDDYPLWGFTYRVLCDYSGVAVPPGR